uniref:Uncharacterized protein n=1 Tax=Anguilla anguilla TaxID=7936 RepID=A0A0E9W6U0_ANGAN
MCTALQYATMDRQEWLCINLILCQVD